MLFRIFLFSKWYFYGTKSGKVTTLHEIFAGVGSGMFILETDHLIWMSPALQESYHCHSFQGYSNVTIYYFEASQYLIFSILMGGCKVSFC